MAIVLLTAACAKMDEKTENPEDGLVHYSLVAGRVDTKAHLGTQEQSSIPTLWDDSDELAVYDGVAVRKFKMVPGSNQGNEAVFSGEISASAKSLEAVYPYDAVVSHDSKGFNLNIPDEQVMGEGGADPRALVSTATAEVGSDMSFRNAVALLSIPVNADIEKIYLHSVDSSLLNGNSTVVSMSTQSKTGVCRVAVLPGSFKGMRLFVSTSSGDYLTETANTLNASKSSSIRLFSSDIPLKDKVSIIYDEKTLTDFLSASTSGTKSSVYVVKDIAVKGKLPQAAGFAGVFNGQNHIISGIESSKGLFAENDGTIKNLILSSDCSFIPESLVFGCFVNENDGTLEGLVNMADVTYSASSVANSLCHAGIAAKSWGPIINCCNKGNLTVTVSSSVVAAGLSGICSYLADEASGCVNEGNITFRAGYLGGKSTLGDLVSIIPATGGICAYALPGFALTSCKNSGTVEFVLSSAEKGLGLGRLQVGGIVGAPRGAVCSCDNEGPVNVVISHTTKGTEITEDSCIMCMGGIGGGDFHFTSKGSVNANTDYIDCVNRGDITFYTDASNGNSTLGGIVGWPGQEDEHTKVCKNCINDGEILCMGKGKVRVGGIQGGSGNMESCTNNGKIIARSLGASSAVGGIGGFHTTTHYFRNCSSFGDVIAESVISGGLGGLIGNLGNQANSTGEGCTVKCKVSNSDSDGSYTGMVIGRYNGTTKKTVVGQSISPVTVWGTLNLGSSDIKITSSNVEQYKQGTSNSSTNHTLYVNCSEQSPTRQEKLDAVLQSLFHTGEPGAAVLVLEGDEIIFDKGYGIADITTKKAIDGDTFFNIASCSKQFTAVGILQLVEKGLLSLDDPVSKYYPEWTAATFWKDVKIKHLLSHCSGVPDKRSSVLHLTKQQQIEGNDEITMQYFPLLDDSYLKFTPGSYYDYMNPTFVLCGDLIGKISGKQFIDYMHDNVFVPAGMTGGTQYFSPETEKDIPNMSHAYYYESGKWHEYDYGEETFFATRPDGGIYTSTHEFVKWEKALRKNTVITEDSRILAQTPKTQVTGSPYSSYQNRENTWYGYGWFIEPKTSNTDEVIYHTGDNGDFQILAARYPEKNALVLIFANRSDWDRYPLMQQFESILGY